MAELLLTQAVDQAEEAIETGNYGGAIETCQRILGEFPEFARAHRIMAEAYAEQGDADSARQAYQRTLERDPQSIPAHLGLAMIAEEAGEIEGALAHYQVAWEIDPRRRDLREHVSRLSQQIYGDEGRLYLTRAALVSLHFHAGRWDRAVSEAAQVLHELSQRLDVQIRMAEALWRRGDDEQARQVCTTILRTLPSAVVPLLILADIHRRQGNEGAAADMLEQARAIDPDGVRAADLIMIGLDDQADFLTVEDVPTIEERVLTEEPATRYAPAPDFIGDDEEIPSPSGPEPAAAEMPPAEPAAPDQAASAQEFEPDPSLQPFRWEDIGDVDLEASDLAGGVDEPQSDHAGLSGEDVGADASAEDEAGLFDLFTDEELEQARPKDNETAGYTGMLESLDSEGMRPFDPSGRADQDEVVSESMGPETPEEVVEEFAQDPFQPEAPAEPTAPMSGLPGERPEEAEEEPTPAADTDPFDVDWSRVDEEIEHARPGEIPRGYTDELRSLDDIGVEPFSVEESEGEAAAQPEDTDELDDLLSDQAEAGPAEETAEFGEPVPEDADLDALTREWDSAADEPSEASAETEDVQASDEGIAEAERSEALESLEDLFGDYEADSFKETEPLRAADAGSFDMSGLAESEDVEAPDETPAEPELDETLEPFWFQPPAEEPEPEAASGFAAEHGPHEEPAEPAPTAEMNAAPEPSAPRGPAEPFSVSAERLGFGEDLLDRARAAKEELIRRGVIGGLQPLPGAGVSIDSLRGAVEQDPRNIDHRIALASALVEESPDEALEQFRWLYRNAPERATEIVDELSRLIEVMSERQGGAHRLLAAVYRRHGDWRLAATHYEESLMLLRRHLK